MDAWGVTDGYWDVAGEWHTTDEDVRQALLEAMGAEGTAPVGAVWSIRHGEAHHLQSLCEVLLEDGTQLPAAQLAPDLPVGYHQLLPTDGGPATRLVVAPAPARRRPAPGAGRPSSMRCTPDWTWGTGDLGDLKDLVRWTGSLGGRRPRQPAARELGLPSSPARTTRPAGASERALRPGGRRPGCDARRGDLAAADAQAEH